MDAQQIGLPPTNPGDRRKPRVMRWLVLVAVCIAIVGGIAIWMSIRRSVADATTCLDHFKKIVLALHQYHDTNRQFPPAYFAGKAGRPIHSWRVLVLPFLGEQSLYNKYRFDEPWDGPHNRELASQMPAVFRCPADRGDMNNTSYLVVTGEGTVFPGAMCRRFSDILDGADYTILFVEAADSRINWMQPRDLTYEQALKGINPPEGPGISGRHGGFAFIATASGGIWALPENTSRDILRKLLLCNDGEVIPDFGRQRGSAIEAPKAPDRPSEGAVYK